MPGQNPYSQYLPANNPSMFEGRQKSGNDKTLSTVLGIGGGALGLILGGFNPAAAMKGYSIGKGIGSMVESDGLQGKAQGLQQIVSGARGTDWYKQQAAKSAAANILSNMGGTKAGS